MKNLSEIKRSTVALGTFIEVKCLAPQDQIDDLQNLISDVFAQIIILENRLSFFKSESDLAKFNQSAAGDEIAIGYELATLLKVATVLNHKTDGIFNVIKPHKTDQKTTEFFTQKQRQIKLLQKCEIDLGGIAKGFIVDKAVKLLSKRSRGGIVNAGGDIRVFGEYVAPIHIRDPFDHNQKLFLGNHSNCAIASSCISENSKERGGKSSIYQEKNIVHATVIGRNCAIADALTKVVLIDENKAAELLRDLDYAAMAIDRAGKIFNL